jgi:hypothetical protein
MRQFSALVCACLLAAIGLVGCGESKKQDVQPAKATATEPAIEGRKTAAESERNKNVESPDPRKAEPPAPDVADIRPGDIMIVEANSLPTPLHGLPVPRRMRNWERLDKLVSAKDGIGALKECDGISLYFVRAQTKVRVIDPRAGRIGDTDFVEVRLLSGPHRNESAFAPRDYLDRAPRPPDKLPKIDHIPDKEQREMFDGFVRACNTAYEQAADGVSPLGREGIALTLRTKRFEYEEKALGHYAKAYQQLIQGSPRAGSEFEAVIWKGIVDGWPREIKDF